MPAEEGVATPGWDGVVECSVGNRFVPAGRSGWELSTTQSNAHGKACEDYDKRRRDIPDSDRAETSYVAVICAKLNSWPSSQIVPGLDSDGAINKERLNCWVDHVRQRLAESDRTKIGDQRIGAGLAASPPEPDGEWPSPAVRDLIERLNSDHIDLGITMAIRAQRGITTRSPIEGGDQERDLAGTYHQKSLQFSDSPRTSAIFKDLADTYQRDARRHDHDAETHRRGLSP